MEENNVIFEILVHGRPVKEYSHKGLVYVEGRPGTEFTLRVANNRTIRRALAVVTVDGRSVMNGRPGSYASGGYVLKPYSSIVIPGWRLDNEEVAKFFFTGRNDSYAAQMGAPADVGVIGCAVFHERIEFPDPAVFNYFEEQPILGGYKGGNIGTGFGKRIEHRVIGVEFERESIPFTVFEIHYNDRNGLEALGINFRERPQIAGPNPFPGEPNHGCPPPPGWRE